MSNELQLSYTTGRTTYTVIRNQTSGYIWSTSGGTSGAFEAFTSGNWVNYSISLTEEGITGYYKGNFPSTMGAGVYSVTGKERLGGTAAQTDPTIATGDVNWNGSITMPLSDLATSGQVGQIAPIRLAKGVAVSGFPIFMVSAADHVTPFTSGVLSGQISRNGGSFGALQSGTFTEVGLGFYRVNLTSGDVSADTIAMVFTGTGISGGTADQRSFSMIMQKVSGSL